MPIIYLALFLLAYLLGSIPSAYLIGKWLGKIDIRDEGDGHISAAAVYRRLGLWQFVVVVAMDIGKAAMAVLMAEFVFNVPIEITMLTGAFSIVGHQWSPFIKFQGGQGATTIGGVLFSIVLLPSLGGGICGVLLLLLTKNSTLCFAVTVVMISIIILICQLIGLSPQSPLLVAYPVILGLMLAIKALQIKYLPRNAIKVK